MDGESQLQFFDPPAGGVFRPLVTPVGRFEMRHDHAMLLGMAGLLGIAVIFACGIERGKQLARSERMLIAPPSSMSSSAPASMPARVESPVASPMAPSRDTPASKPAVTPRGPKRVASPASSSRFAVQVVSYTKPELAARELKRLQARGESAFLLKRGDKAVLFVGPFPSRQRAKEKLAGLKPRYRDCFVRNL